MQIGDRVRVIVGPVDSQYSGMTGEIVPQSHHYENWDFAVVLDGQGATPRGFNADELEEIDKP